MFSLTPHSDYYTIANRIDNIQLIDPIFYSATDDIGSNEVILCSSQDSIIEQIKSVLNDKFLGYRAYPVIYNGTNNGALSFVLDYSISTGKITVYVDGINKGTITPVI